MIYRRIKENGEFNSYWTTRKPFVSKQNSIRTVEMVSEALNLDKLRVVPHFAVG
jgi:hypothetical protein